VPAPTIAEAVFSRTLSAIKEERQAAACVLTGPDRKFTGDRDEFIDHIRRASMRARSAPTARDFACCAPPTATSAGASTWPPSPGCGAPAASSAPAFSTTSSPPTAPDPLCLTCCSTTRFAAPIETNQAGWRSVVARAAELGIPVPAFSSALAYYDGYRSERLPANLLQAQRDYFGAHTYERVDKPRGEFFHTEW
jgi:6-phosphogluconate dehydrogenase